MSNQARVQTTTEHFLRGRVCNLIWRFGLVMVSNLHDWTVNKFSDLRLAVEDGRLQYPYSTRELLAVVRHLDRYPDEPLDSALASILALKVASISILEPFDVPKSL